MPSSIPYKDLIRLIEDGMAVDAKNTNAPIKDLEQRTTALKQILDALSAGEALSITSVLTAEGVEVGQPVFFNTSTKRFEKAKVALDYDTDGVWGVPASSSFCRGIVTYKKTATTADVVTIGLVRALNIAEALISGDTDESGPYYLSAREAGKIEKFKAPAAPFVGYRNKEENTFYVAPEVSGGMTDHVHYKLNLYAVPAGTPNDPDAGEKHSISVSDSSLPGWLPVTDSVFQGTAPTGAKFGYNIAQHPELAAVFPPLPLDSYSIHVFGDGRGTIAEPEEIVKVTPDGIWWMVDDFGWAPWSVDYWNCEAEGSGVAGTVAATRPTPIELQDGNGYRPYIEGTCYDLNIIMWFTKLAAKTNDGVVASLTPRDGSPIVIKDCNWLEEANSGHLTIDIDLDFTEDEEFVDGSLVLKEVDGSQFKKGRVVEGIKSASSAISVTSGHTKDNGYKQGELLITFNDPNVNDRELDVSLVAVNGVIEDSLTDVLYLGFRPDRDSSLRGRIEIPSSGFDAETDYEMKLVFWVLGTAAGALPDLTVSYRNIPEVDTPTALPSAETGSFTLELNEITVAQNQYIKVETEAFDISSSDTIYFTVTRTASGASDTYSGNVGFLKQKGVISPKA